jgi:hypothetical protein
MPEPAVPVHLNVIQAVRSLLYLPVYLAAERLAGKRISLNILNPHDSAGAEIVGDAEAFDEFMRRDDLHFCICDPMLVLLRDCDPPSEAVIVGTLIRKAALWSMSKDETLFNHVVAGGPRFNIFDSPYIAGKTVAAYTRPSTAGAIATYYRAIGLRRWHDSFHMYEVENGRELQYLDVPYRDTNIDVVITADLLAFMAHYNYNKNARELHSFSDDWDSFFFTGIITKRSMLTADKKQYVEQFLSAIKQSTTELYEFATRKQQLPGLFIDELVNTIERYTMFHLHPSLIGAACDKRLIVDRAITLYLERRIASDRLVVDVQSFQNAFEIRNYLDRFPKTCGQYYSRLVDNRIAAALDKRGQVPFLRREIRSAYDRAVRPYKTFWSVAIPSVAAILFHVVATWSWQSIVISIIAIVVAAWYIGKFLNWFDRNIG